MHLKRLGEIREGQARSLSQSLLDSIKGLLTRALPVPKDILASHAMQGHGQLCKVLNELTEVCCQS